MMKTDRQIDAEIGRLQELRGALETGSTKWHKADAQVRALFWTLHEDFDVEAWLEQEEVKDG